MLYRVKNKLNIHDKDNHEISDNIMFRQMLNTLINKAPVEELKKLFQFRVIDPFSSEIEAKLVGKIPITERYYYMCLRDDKAISYELSIDI